MWCIDVLGRLWPRTVKAAMMRRLGVEAWPAGISHARCLLAEAGRAWHPAPANGCMCGLYGWHAPKSALAARKTPDPVAGAIAAWGDVEVHATGFRAAHARPVALALPAGARRLRTRTALEPLRRASERSDIPLVDGDALAEEATRHGAPLAPHVLPPARLAAIRRYLSCLRPIRRSHSDDHEVLP